METEPESGEQVSGEMVDAVDVYWRAGCGYCSRLLRALQRAGVTVQMHDIWADETAIQFVRHHNRGNETVPTVAVGAEVMTNPAPKQLVEQLRRQHPHLVAPGSLSRLFGDSSPSKR